MNQWFQKLQKQKNNLDKTEIIKMNKRILRTITRRNLLFKRNLDEINQKIEKKTWVKEKVKPKKKKEKKKKVKQKNSKNRKI